MELSAKYAAGIPLEFGHDFAIEYRDTIQGIPAELGQIMEYGTLGLGGSVTSSIPLNFDMSVLLLDSEDNLIEMAETSGKQVISGCGPNGTPVTTPLDIVLEKKDGVDMSDVSSIVLLFKANTAADPPHAHSCSFPDGDGAGVRFQPRQSRPRHRSPYRF